MSARSLLYVPGDRPDRFDKAVASGADAVIIDLEDAVGEDHKVTARTAVSQWLSAPPSVAVWVRVNNRPELLGDDLEMVTGSHAAGAVMPKASVPACEAAASRGLKVQALIETALGLRTLTAIAGCAGVVRLALGEADLCAELGIVASPDARELWAIRSSVVVESAAAGLGAPVGPVPVALTDEDGVVSRSSLALRRQGFSGRGVIHPSQVAAVNDAFTPNETEVAEARRIVDAFEAAGGATAVVDGRFVDMPIVVAARRTLDAVAVGRRPQQG